MVRLPISTCLHAGNLSLATGSFGGAVAEFTDARDRAYRAGNRESVLDLTARLVWANLRGGANRSGRLRSSGSPIRGKIRHTTFAPTRASCRTWRALSPPYAGDLGAVSARRLEIETTPGAPPEYAKIIEGLYYLKSGSAWEAIPPRFAARSKTRPNPYTRLLLGMAYFESGDASRAWTVLEENVEGGESLLDSPPSLPQSFLYLAKSLEERGEDHLAAIAYNEFYNYRSDLRRSAEPEGQKPSPIFHDHDR